jgi:hypothetical protein
MQKEIQKELNDLKIKKESWEIDEKEFDVQESILMKKLDTLTADFENLRSKLKMLIVWEVIW